MHKGSMVRMKWFVDNYVSKLSNKHIKILDVGSYDYNGSYKSLFADTRYDYKGLDMSPGPNVDISLENPYDWSQISTDEFDVVISGQTFEHAEFFWILMEEMTRVLKPNGLLCVIAPNGFKEHRFPVDCYRFYTDGMVALARYVGVKVLHAHTNCSPSLENLEWYSSNSADSVLIAQKIYSGVPIKPNFKNYQCIAPNHEEIRGGLYPYTPKEISYLTLLRRAKKFLRSILLRLNFPNK